MHSIHGEHFAADREMERVTVVTENYIGRDLAKWGIYRFKVLTSIHATMVPLQRNPISRKEAQPKLKLLRAPKLTYS
jgi:hypothetical protein